MKITIWGKGKGSKALAKALNCKRNRRIADVVIYYKKTNEHPNSRAVWINHPNAIRKSSHKYNSLKIMQMAGLNVPKYSTSLWDLKEQMGGTGMILGRKNYHTKGQDITISTWKDGRIQSECTAVDGHAICLDEHEHGSDYFVEYLKPKGEYRYHVAFGKVILCTKKMLTNDESDAIIRNHQNGLWRQVVCKETERFSKACIKAVKAHGLDFGAVDFINVGGEPYMLEINTAPALEVENRREVYANAIKGALNVHNS